MFLELFFMDKNSTVIWNAIFKQDLPLTILPISTIKAEPSSSRMPIGIFLFSITSIVNIQHQICSSITKEFMIFLPILIKFQEVLTLVCLSHTLNLWEQKSIKGCIMIKQWDVKLQVVMLRQKLVMVQTSEILKRLPHTIIPQNNGSLILQLLLQLNTGQERSRFLPIMLWSLLKLSSKVKIMVLILSWFPSKIHNSTGCLESKEEISDLK